MGARITKQLAEQSLAGLTASISEKPALNRAVAKFSKLNAEEATKRRRVVLLNLGDDDDTAFWQLLHNRPDKFKVLSEKESHQRNEYVVRVIFFELGDELPEVKTKNDFFAEYIRNYDVE